MVELKRIGNRAVHRAQEENRRLGIPNVYSIGGRIYYEQPDGTLTREEPPFERSSSGTSEGGPEPE
ncbi:MAG: hypothetical protein BRD55_05680 [Bacteroidetes bacterium SW_9_63_38]|nr:MAG: hypothetical protein BRD55_05680 [Bacteroidetes bacterium SW_9_63_38]